MDHSTDNNTLIETLLLERDELYQELSRLRGNDKGTLEAALEKNREYEAVLKDKDNLIKQLTDQLTWCRRKF